MLQEDESIDSCSETKLTHDTNLKTIEATKLKSDANNNRIMRRRIRKNSKKLDFSRTKANLPSSEVGAKFEAPVYIPSYVRRVNAEPKRHYSPTLRSNAFRSGSRRLKKLPKTPDPLRSNNSMKKCKLKRSRVPLKSLEKNNSKMREIDQQTLGSVSTMDEKVHVKAAVAAMEARIADNSPPIVKPKPAKPPKPLTLAPKPPGKINNIGVPATSSLNRDSENSFKSKINTWNQKSETGKEQLTFADGSQTNNSKSFEKPRGIKPNQRMKSSLFNNVDSSSPVNLRDRNQPKLIDPQSKIISTAPPIPPPKPMGQTTQSNLDIRSSNAVTTNQMTKSDINSSSATSSVNDKAKIFIGTKKTLFDEESRKPSGYNSPPFQRHRTYGADGSIDEFSNNRSKSPQNRRTSDGQCSAVRTWKRNESDKSTDLKDRLKKFDEHKLKTRSSTYSSTTSDNDQQISGLPESSKRVVSLKEKIAKQNSPVLQKSSLHTAKTPPQTPPRPSPLPKPMPTTNPQRISSSLQSAIDNACHEQPKVSTKYLLPENNSKKSFLDEVRPKTSSLSKNSPNISRSFNSSRSSTDSSPELPPKSNSSYLAKQTGSLERVPASNNQRSNQSSPRTSSVVDESPPLPPKLKPKTPKPKRSAPVAPHVNNGAPDPTSPSNSSPSPNNVNPLELYATVHKENNTQSKNKRPDSSASVTSMDSGIRTSLEIPVKGPNMDIPSDFDQHSDGNDSLIGHSRNSHQEEPSPTKEESTKVKLHNIAKELLATEESYVSVLHLIDQVFHKQILEAATQKHIMPEQVVHNIFSHIPAIYQFHNTFLLPQLKERIANWETKPQLGDIMTQAAPFLKMYSLYVQNFDDALNTIKLWSEKSAPFNEIIQNIQKTPECNHLTLQHHMLGPVQRVPRYRLLLEDYVKRLPQDSNDREESEKALDLITVAATHNNETMKKIEKFHKLLNVFSNLTDVNFDSVDVSRELVKEGKIIKISARNGEKAERYIYLFTDMLLCCTPLRIPLQGKTYKISARIDLEGMNIGEVKNPTVSFAFCVNGTQKSIEFATNTEEEKDSWVEAIQNAIDLREKNRQTFINAAVEHESSLPENSLGSPTHKKQEEEVIDISDAELGTRAPRWVKDHEVTMCMICSKAFNKLLRRRHHCRACGRVVCGECSENKYLLQYEPEKAQKVCTRCYNVFTGSRRGGASAVEKKGVLEVGADVVTVNSVLADYLFFSEYDKKKTAWVKTWCVIPNNEPCLYFYGAHQDIKAQMTLPLPGFEVSNFDTSEHKFSFKLKQGRKVYSFASDDSDVVDRWKYALRKASVGDELNRDDVLRLGQHSTLSEPEWTDDEWD